MFKRQFTPTPVLLQFPRNIWMYVIHTPNVGTVSNRDFFLNGVPSSFISSPRVTRYLLWVLFSPSDDSARHFFLILRAIILHPLFGPFPILLIPLFCTKTPAFTLFFSKSACHAKS